ncbi:NAD(P)H-hydrate epimerase [Haladaptatus sp. NG-SE-30]
MVEFRTDRGDSVPAVTADEMREIDRVAVEDVGLPLLSMMENAGRTLARHARDLSAVGIVVFAGGGGNGGGGLCSARHLANHGVSVRVVLDRDADELTGVTRTQYRILDSMDVPVMEEPPMDISLAVDAVLGYGLDGSPRGRVAELVQATEEADRVLSLDVPSGVNASTGEMPGVVVTPDRTLTLALPKTGLADVPGELFLADIAIPATVYHRADIEYESVLDGRYSCTLSRE